MKWLRVLIFLTFAGQLAASQGPSEREEAPHAGPTISPVLRPLEPPESRVILLPGSKTQRPGVSKPAVPSRPQPAPSAVRVAPAFVLPPMPVAPVPPPPELAEAPAPSLTSAPLLPPPALPAATEPPSLPAAPEPPAPPVAFTAAAQPFTRPALPDPPAAPPVVAEPEILIPPPVVTPAPAAPGPAFEPREFQAQSALFLQSRIGQWNLADTRLVLGEPARQRPALDDQQAANGTIFAFADPTGRYKELELDFDSESNRLRTVFAYPQDITWQEIRQLFGANVTSTKANKGRMFYSYLNRHLDVLVAPDGQVISLGLY